MLPSYPSRTIRTPVIKIKSPKSAIKLHRETFNERLRISPELTLPVRASSSQNNYESSDKIGQAWNRMKIVALSKAIAISPDVGVRSIGRHSISAELECNRSDTDDCNKPDLGKAVTSTPVKPKTLDLERTTNNNTTSSSDKSKSYSLDTSETNSSKQSSNCFGVDELIELDSFREMCIQKVKEKERKSVQRVKSECLKAWMESDNKIKEKLAALKIEMEKERILRAQIQYDEALNILIETKAIEHLEAKNIEHEKRIAETNEKLRQIELKRKELEEKQKQKREELKQCINGIYKQQLCYNQKYNQITDATKKCKDLRMLNDKVSCELSKLKGMNENFLKLIERSKEGSVTLKDLKFAETLVQQVTVISELFSHHSDEINKSVEKAEEDRRKEEQEKELKAKQEEEEKERERQQKAKEESEKIEKEKTEIKQKSATLVISVEDCISPDCLAWHTELRTFLEDYEKTLQPLLTDDSLKKFRFDCQKAVNVPVNAISPIDHIHVADKRYKLSRLLQGQAVNIGDSLFLATGHPLGIPFCTNLLAKKFVKQGEHTVSSKPEAAFAIAAVIVALWVENPDFGRLLLAHFHRECPYLIPAFMPQLEGQTNEDYYKMLAYQYSEDGKVEPQDKFLRRMSGIMRLYAAILITPLNKDQSAQRKNHPHSMRDAWRWFAATLNLRPRIDISATLIYDFLEVTGGVFFNTYSAQFTKLLHTLCVDYFPLIEQITPDGCGGPVVRLKSFLEKILREGRVPSPPGLLPPNFW